MSYLSRAGMMKLASESLVIPPYLRGVTVPEVVVFPQSDNLFSQQTGMGIGEDFKLEQMDFSKSKQ